MDDGAGSTDAITGPAPPTTPRRTFLVIAVVLVILTVIATTRLGPVLVLFLGATALALASCGVRCGQFGLVILSLAAIIRDGLVGTHHPATYLIVFLCVLEFAVLMRLVADRPVARTDRHINFGLRFGLAMVSVWWVINGWPPVVGLGQVTLAAYGLIISCLSGRRTLMVYVVLMVPYVMMVGVDGYGAAQFPELRETSGTMPQPYTFEFAVVALVFVVIAFACLLFLDERQSFANAEKDDTLAPEAPRCRE